MFVFRFAHRRPCVSSYHLPVIANEEVFPVCGFDGHHFIRVAFEHLLYRLHFFMATYANFYAGISVVYKVLNRCKNKLRKKTNFFKLIVKLSKTLDLFDQYFENCPIVLENKFRFWFITDRKYFVKPET